MQENEWTQQKLIPLLRLLGYRNVRFTGGANEMGRDVVFADYDRFAILRYYCAQVKYGDVGVAKRQLKDIVDQLSMAYETRYEEPTNGREYRMSGVYFVVSGAISDQAKRYLKEHTGQWLHCINGDGLDTAQHAAGIRLTDPDRASLLALMQIDLTTLMIPMSRKIVQIDLEGGNITLDPNIAPIHNIERFIDFAVLELNHEDVATFMRLYTTVLALNAMFLKLPPGTSDASIIPTIAGYKDLARTVLDIAEQCTKVIKFMSRHPRPEPGAQLPPSRDATVSDNAAT